jgi:hypothetical protein
MEQQNPDAVISRLAERYQEYRDTHTSLKPGKILTVVRDHGNPHAIPYVPNPVTSLAVVVEVQSVFVKVVERQRGLTAEPLRLEQRVMVIVDGRPDQSLLSEYDSWSLYMPDEITFSL